MRIGLLGIDANILEFVRALPPPFALEAIFSDDDLRENSLASQFSLRSSDELLQVADNNKLDGVFVAGGNWTDKRTELVRQLLQAEVPLLVSWTGLDPLLAYELDMVRQSYGGVLAAFAPRNLHPVIEQLRQLVQGSDRPLGDWEQIVIERFDTDRSRKSALRLIAEDADMIRRVVTPILHVTASGVNTESELWSGLSLQMVGAIGPSIRWNFSSPEPELAFRISLSGTKGKWVWQGDSQGKQSQVILIGTAPNVTTDSNWDWRRATCSMFAEAQRGKSPDPVWQQVCQAMEVVDATERSLTRGRRIDLTGRTVTEKDTFRGMMSAGGCFLILAALLILIISSVVEGIRLANLGPVVGEANQRPTPYWAILLAVPMIVFLLLQFLQFIIRKPRSLSSDSAP